MMESLESRECLSADVAVYGGFQGGVRIAVGDVNGDGPTVHATALSVDVWEHAAEHSGNAENPVSADAGGAPLERRSGRRQ